MKFSNSLKFNAVSEWWEEYIAYAALKKQIYQLEKEQHGTLSRSVYRDVEHGESSALLGTRASMNTVFEPLLDHELRKVSTFYSAQERELLEEVDELSQEVDAKEAEGVFPTDNYYYDDDGDDDDDDDDDDNEGDRSPMVDSHDNTLQRRRRGSTSRRGAPAGRRRRSSSDTGPPHRRYSISSSDEGDLDNSIPSLSQTLPAVDEGSVPVSRRRRRNDLPPTEDTGKKRLTQIFGLMSSITSTQQPDSVWTSKSNYAWDTRSLYKRKFTRLYISLTSLRSYVELNYSGFRKILKKYDKITYSELKDHFMHDVLEPSYPFQTSTRNKLADAINRVVGLYARCVTHGDVSVALKQLRVHQREHIAWERDTVWRQMINRERRGESDGTARALGVLDDEAMGPHTQSTVIQFQTLLGQVKFKRRRLFFPVALGIFIALLNLPVASGVEANNCLAILIFATVLWATEAIPLFVTSLLLPLLLVMLRTVRSLEGDSPERTRLTTPEATKYIFSVMFTPTIMLLIGGFTIASALSKTNIDRVLITRVLSLAGTRPSTVLLAFMGVSCFASMWISNVAAPTLCFTLIQPILRTLPRKSSFGPCLILGIALAANIGGQSSPISSPQNLIALQYMNPPPDWLQWFAVALPVSAISIILIWLLLLVSYRPGTTADGEQLVIKEIRPTKEKFSAKQWWVTLVCLVTIALWCVEHEIEDFVGDMGIIAIIPIVAFFSTGVLKKDDFEQFLWSIVFLAMGGIALGKAVDSSGLLDEMDGLIRGLVSGLTIYEVVLVLSAVVLVVSTFISHTIASVLLVPIAAEVGLHFPDPHPRLLVFITALICSTGMGMPVSGFPNQTAANQVDEMGQLYLTNVDFLKNGVPASIIATLVVSTVGYLLIKAIGF